LLAKQALNGHSGAERAGIARSTLQLIEQGVAGSHELLFTVLFVLGLEKDLLKVAAMIHRRKLQELD